MIWTILSLIAAVLCYSIRELYYHGKLKWQDEKKPFGFWGENSDYRKYKMEDGHTLPPKDNWYYRFFDIDHLEKFPGSATGFVLVSDGVHLLQTAFKLFLALSFAPLTGWIWAGVIWLIWGIFFTIFYKILSR
ncbi:MAG TPA: hypothetical protein VGK46_04700 [Saprospiraceae bacterium]